jgi:hypothetical protein
MLTSDNIGVSMEDKKLLQDLKRHRPKLRRGKSDLYRWLEENLQRLTGEGYGTPDGPEWQELTDRLNRIGKVNKDGQPLGLWGVISIFKRVKRDVEARQREARTGTPTPKQQTRMPKGWTPPVASKAASVATRSSPFAPTAVSTGSGGSGDMTPEELRAGVAAVIAKRSGR